jgi:4-hydroxymandelate oxidase
MSQPLPKLERIPPAVASVSDYEALAREGVSAPTWAYLAGGAADEWTLRENAAAFQRLPLRTRVLRDLAGGNPRLELFGQSFAAPILLAPVAYHRLFDADGESATVMAAGALQTGMVVSTQASLPLEDVARAAKAPLWFQLYIQPDRDFTRDLVRRAEAAGYAALVLTVDARALLPRDR